MSAPEPAPLRLLYFAWLRERLGAAEESVTLPDGVTTVGELLAWQCRRGAAHAAVFVANTRVRCAVNHEFATQGTRLAAGDEVAFFPPVTGG